MHKISVSNDSNGHRRFLLQLDASTLDKYFSLPDFPSIHDFGENFCGVVEFTPKDWQQVLSTIQLLKEEMNPAVSGKNIIPLLLVAQLAALFIRNRKHQKQLPDNHSRATNTAHSNIYQTVQEIILYLENNSHESHSLDDISDRFYISRAYLTRVFKSFTGFTVTEYIAFCRIRKAKILLSETNLSITDIATQVGFGNVTYFERIFKRMTDYTPLQYRKQSR